MTYEAIVKDVRRLAEFLGGPSAVISCLWRNGDVSKAGILATPWLAVLESPDVREGASGATPEDAMGCLAVVLATRAKAKLAKAKRELAAAEAALAGAP